VCNAPIVSVEKKEVLKQLPTRVAETYDTFRRCSGCGRVYWQGSHYEKIIAKIEALLAKEEQAPDM